MAYKILIYEDNARLLQSLQLLLTDGTENIVVGAYHHCDNAKEEVILHVPDLVLMDLDMPGIGGIEGTKLIKENAPNVKIVVHTIFDDDSRIFDSICAGADGYILKNTSPVRLQQVLIDVMQGGALMSPFIAKRVFQYFKEKGKVPNDYDLTHREQEILIELVKGDSYKMIGATLGIKIDTVRKHLQNVYHKLHVNSGTEAVALALREKIVTGFDIK